MSGWPDDWNRRRQGHDCPLCAAVGDGDNEHGLFVADLPFSEVRLERRSRLSGYCIVVWKGGHITEAHDLDDESAIGYWRDVMTVASVLEAEFQPMKMNLLTLGNWVPHLHTHVLPRYVDDPAPGGPITWADVSPMNRSTKRRCGLRWSPSEPVLNANLTCNRRPTAPHCEFAEHLRRCGPSSAPSLTIGVRRPLVETGCNRCTATRAMNTSPKVAWMVISGSSTEDKMAGTMSSGWTTHRSRRSPCCPHAEVDDGHRCSVT